MLFSQTKSVVSHVPFKARNKKRKLNQQKLEGVEKSAVSKKADVTNMEEKSTARMHARCEHVVSANGVLHLVLC